MTPLLRQLSTYATYHRDRRNIATHFVGIPMIVLGIEAALGRAAVDVGGVPLSLAMLGSALAAVFYLRTDLRYGAAMTAVLAAAVWGGHAIAAIPSALAWGGVAAGLFVVGWALQFVGHAFEGRKPAFVDDAVGFLIGPLFLLAEAVFALGLDPALHAAVVREAGPTRTGSAADLAR
jgi:uncharacterized membrane protein YGL010W